MYQGAFCGGQAPEVAPNVNTLFSTLPQASQSIVELFSCGDKKKEGIEKAIKSLLRVHSLVSVWRRQRKISSTTTTTRKQTNILIILVYIL